MQSLFGFDLPMPYVYFASLAITALLIAIFGLVLKRFKAFSGSRDGSGIKNRQPRLGVVDTFSIDRQRQLVIVRRDNVEHLIMIGGTSDLLVEANIVRATLNSPTLPREAQQFLGQNRTKLRPVDEQPRADPPGNLVSERVASANQNHAETDRNVQGLQAVQTEIPTSSASKAVPLSSTPAPDQMRRIMADTLRAAPSKKPVASPSETGQFARQGASPQSQSYEPKSPKHELMPSTATRQLPSASQTAFPTSDKKSQNDPQIRPESLDDSLRRLLVRRPANQSESNSE